MYGDKCQLGRTGYCLQIFCVCEAEKTNLGVQQPTISHVRCKWIWYITCCD